MTRKSSKDIHRPSINHELDSPVSAPIPARKATRSEVDGLMPGLEGSKGTVTLPG